MIRSSLACWVAVVLAGCSEPSTCELAPDLDPALLCLWTDSPGSPLIEPPANHSIIADPTVVTPEDSPDGRWHMFAHALTAIYHYTSDDGLAWTEVGHLPFTLGSLRPYIYKEGATYYLLFEQYASLDSSTIQIMESSDLVSWSESVTILEPTLDWETEGQTRVGNPFVMAKDGEYWLYYSAGAVYLDDASYDEPRYVGLARATDLHGPYHKQPQPLVGPDPAVAWRNLGAGSMKLLQDRFGGEYVALENGIYEDGAGASRSAIQVLASADGVSWREVCAAPPLAPTGTGWKQAFVYAFATTRREGELRVYYNGRDGWLDGVERIGMSSVELPCN
ncbi:MAG: hypothetical protein H6Q90_6765 [Deltaproteobacteria bacterium]|nr:hypothetical protein [Deltaproteobacteria bacterium]